jgi:hypothetical protein
MGYPASLCVSNSYLLRASAKDSPSRPTPGEADIWGKMMVGIRGRDRPVGAICKIEVGVRFRLIAVVMVAKIRDASGSDAVEELRWSVVVTSTIRQVFVEAAIEQVYFVAGPGETDIKQPSSFCH